MSSNIFYFACHTRERSHLINLLRWTEGEHFNGDFYARSGETLVGDFQGDWTVFLTKDDRFIYDRSLLKRLSEKRRILAGAALEAGLFSNVQEWINQKLKWSIEFDPDKKPDSMIIEGTPPDLLKVILTDSSHEPVTERFFEAPIIIFERIAGYHYKDSVPKSLKLSTVRYLTTN